MMTLKKPTRLPTLPSLVAYRQTLRSCYMAERCLHPVSSCTGSCRLSLAPLALPSLAPGVLDGPYHHVGYTGGERAARVLLLAACIAAAVAVLVQLYGAGI